MDDDTESLTRRNVLESGAVVTAGVAGLSGAVSARGKGGRGKGRKGGAGFTFTEPTVDRFSIVDGNGSSDESFQRGCGKGGRLRPYSFFHVVDSFDGDGETDRLYPHPSDKRFGRGEFKINAVCETETGRDRPAYWVTVAPV